VAIVGIGTDRGAIEADVGASLVGAGMISVLVFPLLGSAIAGPGPATEPTERISAEAATEY
jgi:hypothetical protein